MSEGTPGINPLQAAMRANMRARQVQRANVRVAEQKASRAGFRNSLEEAFNPFSADRKAREFRTLGERANEMMKAQKEEAKHKIGQKEDTATLAQQKQTDNPELDPELLLQLRNFFLKEKLNAEEVLNRVMETYGDPTLADEAIDFFIKTTEGDLQRTMQEARGLLNDRMGREVVAGKNVSGDVHEFSGKGIGEPTELRELYRDVTGNPREHNILFSELSAEYAFEQLKDVVEFLLSSLGSDLKAKGPSIARGELYRLVTEVRVLQSILGVYLFFQGRTDLVRNYFEEREMEIPDVLDFEKMAQQFIEVVDERYPSTAKIFRTAIDLGIHENTIAQIIIFQQFRDAIREVAPRIYRSLQHRYDVLMAIIEALEELEDELEEEEEGDGDV